MSEISVCILRAGGTNCDIETKEAFEDFDSVIADVFRISEVDNGKLFDYDCLVIPGGFSFGDHVRAGTVFAREIENKIGEDLKNFISSGRYVLGICNGFQVLVELGLLPGIKGKSEYPEATLAINESARYECRWVNLKVEDNQDCAFVKNIEKEKLFLPVAHKEGRFLLGSEDMAEEILENNQAVLRYCFDDGAYAKGEYPENPNGSIYDIAGVTDSSGKVFGMMPHPERAFYRFHYPDWTKKEFSSKYADGSAIFKSLVSEIRNS